MKPTRSEAPTQPVRARHPTAEFVARWLTLVITTALIVGAMVGNAAYTQRVDDRSNRDWCELLDSLDQPLPPNASPRSRQILQQIRDLREKKGCT